MNLAARRPDGYPQDNLKTATELSGLVESVVITDDAAFWPILAGLEAVDVVVAQLPAKARRAAQAELTRAREELLFDRRVLAAAIATAVERRLAADAITSCPSSKRA